LHFLLKNLLTFENILDNIIMCGFLGYYSYKHPLDTEVFKDAINTIKHRGTDNQGLYIEYPVMLGHNRLSILDLSTEANQPMISHNQQFIMVYNGEVYNYKELANKYNVKTRTNSDSEVILEILSNNAYNAVNDFNGMFAIAIYNKADNSITLFRDRVGKKPLFYYIDNYVFAFASEIKALLAIPYIKNNITLNFKAIYYYLNLGFIIEPYTIFNNIYKFPAAAYGIYKENKLSITNYWTLEENIKDKTIENYNEAKEILKDLLYSSVKYRLITDVPYCIFLSGGIDSSVVTAIAQKLTGNIKTFSIGFKESKYNEAPFAKKIANYLQTKHTEYYVSEKDAISLIDELINTFDEPFADDSAIPTMIISKLVRNDVKMALSGDGGDELFWGYGTYKWANRLNNQFIYLNKHLLSKIFKYGNNRYKRIANMLDYDKDTFLPAHILSQELYFFSHKEIKKILNFDIPNDLWNNFFMYRPLRKLTNTELQSLFDFKYYLKDDLLVKVDRASMKYTLEVRCPLLDYRIIEFAFNLSSNLKKHKSVDKYLLKQILFDHIPKDFFKRPKWGFAPPLEKWLKNELNFLIQENLSYKVIKKYNFLNSAVINNLVRKFENNHYYLYGRIWNLIVLIKWLENNKFIH